MSTYKDILSRINTNLLNGQEALRSIARTVRGVVSVKIREPWKVYMAHSRPGELFHVYCEDPAASSATERVIWGGSATFNGFTTLAAAGAMRIKAGGDVNDTAAGTGARKVRLHGLDTGYNRVYEDLLTNGALASTATTTKFTRVFLAEVIDSGTYHGSNVGAIIIENSAGTADMLVIAAGRGVSTSSARTVPAGKRVYILKVEPRNEATQESDLYFWTAGSANALAAPYGPSIRRFAWPGLRQAGVDQVHESLEVLEEYTDFWFTAQAKASTAFVSVHCEYIEEDAT